MVIIIKVVLKIYVNDIKGILMVGYRQLHPNYL